MIGIFLFIIGHFISDTDDYLCRWFLYRDNNKTEITTNQFEIIPDTGDYFCVITPPVLKVIMVGRAIVCEKPNSKRLITWAACGRRDYMKSSPLQINDMSLRIACERK